MTSAGLLMPLLDEGTEVWRPVAVEPLGAGAYRILGPMPEDEAWAFAPGSVVVSQLRIFADGEERPVAAALA